MTSTYKTILEVSFNDEGGHGERPDIGGAAVQINDYQAARIAELARLVRSQRFHEIRLSDPGIVGFYRSDAVYDDAGKLAKEPDPFSPRTMTNFTTMVVSDSLVFWYADLNGYGLESAQIELADLAVMFPDINFGLTSARAETSLPSPI